MNYKQNYERWHLYDGLNAEMRSELNLISDDENQIKEHFGAELTFGTGGLRGIMGVGSNRINIYTIGKATQGFANYLIKIKGRSVAIAYDSRNNSKLFAQRAGCVLAANGIKAYVFESLKPTPMLSYAVRKLNCDGGIVITASHNPSKYNGYKVYGADGGQLTLDNANAILSEIQKLDIFSDVKIADYNEMINSGMFEYISSDIDEQYYADVINLTKNPNLYDDSDENEHLKEDIKIVYTPIHGAGAVPVTEVLSAMGYNNLSVVEAQRKPDGNFPTVKYPNPEEKEALSLAMQLAEELNADLVLATDPDADRVGIAARDKKGNLRLLNGNQVGVLLTEYIFSQKLYKNWYGDDFDISDGVVIKTIVTSDLGANIASSYGAKVMETLTGFKFIGEKIKQMEEDKSGKFIFGYEESYGYLAGTFVRDKDAVISSALIAQMATYYKSCNMNIFDALDIIYKKHGYYSENLISTTFEGLAGKEKIENIMRAFNDVDTVKDVFDGVHILENYNESKRYILDEYSSECDRMEKINLPKTNAIKCVFYDGAWFAVRPSGTEPKIKIYISALGDEEEVTTTRLVEISDCLSHFLK